VPVTPPVSRPLVPTSRPHATASAGRFAQLGLPAALVAALDQRGIATPLPIQAATLPDALAGRDVLGQAETGSGKTLAFGLPLLARLAAGAGGAAKRLRQPRALVLVPTRELARQVHGELAPLASAVGLRVLAVYGGAPTQQQIRALRRGVDAVVATPGRLTDLLKQGACSLDRVQVAVLDEADHMADMGFLPAVTWLLDRIPSGGQRLLFSATLDNDIDSLVRRYLADPVRHTVTPAPDGAGAGRRVDHRFLTVTSADKVAVTAELAASPGRVLVFVRTKHGATRLARQLDEAGVRAGALHGNLVQNARERALAAFATGTTPVLVATDIAARGLHVDGVDLVVHFDPPAGHKAYLHRSGRTARAGAAGSVVTLVLPEQAVEVARLGQRAGVSTAAATLRVRPTASPLPSRPGSHQPRHRSRRRPTARRA